MPSVLLLSIQIEKNKKPKLKYIVVLKQYKANLKPGFIGLFLG